MKSLMLTKLFHFASVRVISLLKVKQKMKQTKVKIEAFERENERRKEKEQCSSNVQAKDLIHGV